jgi:maleate isomerase
MAIYGRRARIGYTSPPAATEVFPYEFYKIVPDGVTLVVNTLPLVERNSEEVDRSYEASLRAAHVMARAGVDILCLGGLPINVSRGFANVDDLIAATEKEVGLPVTTSFSCQKAAFEILGGRRAGIVHPYDEKHDDRHMDYMRQFGLDPAGCVRLYAKFIELGQVPEERAFELGREVKRLYPDIDTIYFSCPHYAMISVIEPLEHEYGITVVQPLQAIVWHTLRRCGVNDKIEGYGRLLRDF